MPPASPPDVAPARAESAGRERAENFPVALRLLPARRRDALHAAYALARHIDDLGDDPARTPAQRLEDLSGLEAALPLLWAGDDTAAGPALAPHAPRLRDLPLAPFLDLLAANRLDQTRSRYADDRDLDAYCALSATPVGRLVLAAFAVEDRRAGPYADRICTALQILEHCQDVVEDLRDRDRIYLPGTALDRFGVTEADLLTEPTPAPVRRLVAAQVDRCVALLDAGLPLLDRVRGWARVAIAGYLAGGLATVDALRRSGYDVAAAPDLRRPRRRDVARHGLRLLVVRR